MSSSRAILLKLVRMAMGWETDFSLPDVVNWQEVLDISHEQGVTAIVMDGYEVYLEKNPGAVSFLRIKDNKQLKGSAIGGIQSIEHRYSNHLSALEILAKVLNDKGIPFLILKGFSCARYYAIPNHRGCGDIDIYPGDMFEKSNKALIRAGYDVDPYYYRHSATSIKDVMIENHKVLCDLRGPWKQTRELEAKLEEEGKRSIIDGKDAIIDGRVITGAKYPLAGFNALFLPWHVSAHFMFERVTLRLLLDWALFLTNDGESIDIEEFREAKRKYTYGYSKFADILTNLSLRYLNMPIWSIPSGIIEDAKSFDNLLADKVFDYMFLGKPRVRDENVWKFRWNNVKRVWSERWKYKELYNVSALGFFYYKALGVLFKVGEHD